MTQFLLITVYAPLVSWGDIAVGEVRGSWDRPSRSAILGLVAAALGIVRDAQDEHDALDAGYGVAVRLDAAGTAMIDYHTAQTVSASVVKKWRPRTRAQLLASGEPATILSQRTLRQDALATVALWVRTDARWSLDAIAAALRCPTFTVYAGRKANPLGLPLNPELVSASTLAEAFEQRSPPVPASLHIKALTPHDGWGRTIVHDPCEGFESGLGDNQHRIIRRDGSPNRTRWQFSDRVAIVGTPASERTP